MVSFSKKAPLAAAALAFAASTAEASPQIFPTDFGTATFASGATISFTLTGANLGFTATGGTGAATIASDSYSCEDATTAALGTIADVTVAGNVAGTALTATGDFREVAGLRVDLGAECALILPQEKEGGQKFYGGVLGNFGSGETTVDAILFPVDSASDEASTASGSMSFSVSDVGISGTVTPKDPLILDQKYIVYISDNSCDQPLLEFTGTGTFAYGFEEDNLLGGAFIQTTDPDAQSSFKMEGLVATKETVANKAVRLNLVNSTSTPTDASQTVMCGYISYLPKVRGYIAAYPDAANKLVLVGKASGLQAIPSKQGTMHLHAASASVDDPVDNPICSDGNTVGPHVKVVSTADGTDLQDNFIAGGATTEVEGVAPKPASVLTYLPDALGVAPINGKVNGYWAMEDIKYQAIVIHTRQAGTNLELELKAGCANLGGVDPTETDQSAPNTDGAGSSVVLSAAGLVAAALVNAFMM